MTTSIPEFVGFTVNLEVRIFKKFLETVVFENISVDELLGCALLTLGL